MTISERIRRAIDHSGLTQKEVAHRAGLEEATVSDLLTGKTQKPQFDTVERLVRATGVSFAALFDEPRLQLSAEDANLARRFHEFLGRLLQSDTALKELKQRDHSMTASAATLRDAPPATDIPFDVESVDAVIPADHQRLGARHAYRVLSDVMIGAGLLQGALIFIRTVIDMSSADGEIVVCRLNRMLFLRRLDLRGGRITLENENPRYEAINVTKQDNFAVIGVVVFPK